MKQAPAGQVLPRSLVGLPAPRVVHVTTVDLSLRLLLLNQLAAIRQAGFEVMGASAPGDDVPALQAAGVPHCAVPFTRRLTPGQDLVTLARLTALFRRLRPTIVHTHTPKPGLLGQLAARMAGVPIVINTLHGFYFHDLTPPATRRFYIAMERLAATCSDLILSQNPTDIETAVAERIAPRERLRFLGNGVDLQRFDPARITTERRRAIRAALRIPADVRVIGFVGRLVREKGVVELLTALRALRGRVPPFLCVLVGPVDEEKVDVVGPKLAAELGVADLCRFLGRRDDMPEVYSIMDIFVLPSYREGFPRSAMEAAAMQVPAIVTEIRGCVETVEPGRNGVRVPRADAPALAAAIADLLADGATARAMGRAGRELALERFDERRIFTTVIGVYHELLERKGLPCPAGRTPATGA